MFNSTPSPRAGAKLRRATATGAGEQVRAINFASAAPSKIRGRAEVRIVFAGQRRRDPFSDQSTPVRPILFILVSNAAEIALSLQPSPASDTSAFNRICALSWYQTLKLFNGYRVVRPAPKAVPAG